MALLHPANPGVVGDTGSVTDLILVINFIVINFIVNTVNIVVAV